MYSRNKYDRKSEYSIPPRYDGNAFRRYTQSSRTINGVDEMKAAWQRREKEDIIISEADQTSDLSEPVNTAYYENNECNPDGLCENEPVTECVLRGNKPCEEDKSSSPFDALSGLFDKISYEELLIGAIILVLAGENTNGECSSVILALVILLALR